MQVYRTKFCLDFFFGAGACRVNSQYPLPYSYREFRVQVVPQISELWLYMYTSVYILVVSSLASSKLLRVRDIFGQVKNWCITHASLEDICISLLRWMDDIKASSFKYSRIWYRVFKHRHCTVYLAPRRHNFDIYAFQDKLIEDCGKYRFEKKIFLVSRD